MTVKSSALECERQFMKKNNIILIGMPGCGKSTLGIVLAKILCMDFCDVDLLIQKKIGMSLQNYINTYGVDKFLEAEGETVSQLDCENTVIATGGSAVLTEIGASHLKELGEVVYLSLPLKEIEQRITNLSRRGVAMKSGESLSDVYRYRKPIYEKYADRTVDISGGDVSTNCAKLAEMFSEHTFS